ncbi:MAG: hypothetical protein ACM65M_00295 [Microcoleus sp.]
MVLQDLCFGLEQVERHQAQLQAVFLLLKPLLLKLSFDRGDCPE